MVGGLLLLVLLLAILPSLHYARREMRDGIRRDALAALKNDLEQYNNKHNVYPFTFVTGTSTYVVTEKDDKGAVAWYLRTALENSHPAGSGIDQEAGHNFYYRIVQAGDKTYYDICGGTSTCGNAPK